MGCGKISLSNLVGWILVSSIYLPVILFSLLYLKENKPNKKIVRNYLLFIIIISFIITFIISIFINPLNDDFYYNLFRIYLIVVGFIAFVLCFKYFQKKDWKWMLPTIAAFIGIFMTLSILVLPIFNDLNKPSTSIKGNEIVITDLKNYTLNLCQEITTFNANRWNERPDWEDYGWDKRDEYDKVCDDFDDNTISLFMKYYTIRAANCFYEFEKKGLITDQFLITEITKPTNILSIASIMEGLQSLANQL